MDTENQADISSGGTSSDFNSNDEKSIGPVVGIIIIIIIIVLGGFYYWQQRMVLQPAEQAQPAAQTSTSPVLNQLNSRSSPGSTNSIQAD